LSFPLFVHRSFRFFFSSRVFSSLDIQRRRHLVFLPFGVVLFLACGAPDLQSYCFLTFFSILLALVPSTFGDPNTQDSLSSTSNLVSFRIICVCVHHLDFRHSVQLCSVLISASFANRLLSLAPDCFESLVLLFQ